MPNSKVLNSIPDSLRFSKFTDTVSLPVHGQGVFLFNTSAPTSFHLYNPDKSDGLTVSLSATEFYVTRVTNSNRYDSQTPKGGLSSKSGAYYWFSLDSQNQCMYAGVGEPRIETVCYTYKFDHDKLWEANKIFMESLTTISLDETIQPLRLLKNPITTAVSLKIKDTTTLTMDDVAGNEYLPNAALSPAAQTLYNCISGPKFTLNTPDFPDFAQAIEYSIQTAGLWCNTRLQQKSTEFDSTPQPLETYLRITLGQNNGESPGIPYVMEIWPPNHYSPIHSHSAANAIIRVLSGKINVSMYPFLCDSSDTVLAFGVKEFVKDDITWISPTLNQIHMLKNIGTETCVTIQCYLYDTNDTSHYDYFDYLGKDNAKTQYEPDSDMDFNDFKDLIRKEWNSRPKKKSLRSWFCLA